ncbi:MAG: toxin [Muribaculaceae bacterium]|nr:toxin [Muribaculaceae bacterium]
MSLKDEVEAFLASFHEKVKIFGILFRDDREKNRNALFDLDISRFERSEIIKSIETEDYSEGPIPDELYHGTEMWVFGKDVKGIEVYIKITMGGFNGRSICISFHRAEHPMNYPLK